MLAKLVAHADALKVDLKSLGNDFTGSINFNGGSGAGTDTLEIIDSGGSVTVGSRP